MSCPHFGILGGSFNPIHNGHLCMARQALEQCGLERVLFLPTGTPPHKPEGLADAGMRLAMVRLAIEGEPRFSVSDLEMRRTGNSYTVDTLRILSREHPGCPLWLLIGTDTLLDLTTWREPDEVFRMAGFIVCARPGTMEEEVTQCQRELEARGAVFRQLALTGPDISSTRIRALLAEGTPITGLVPPQVEEYLLRTRLYRKP